MDQNPASVAQPPRQNPQSSAEDTVKTLCAALDDYTLDDMYEILVRFGLSLPQRGSHWLTKKLMMAMFRGDVYCPKYTELSPRPCPKPPVKTVLVEEVNKEIARKYQGRSRCIVTTPQRMPDQRWLLDTLSALNPNHQFFQKGYTPPDKTSDPLIQIKLQKLQELPMAQHALFKGLPHSLVVKRKSLKAVAIQSQQSQNRYVEFDSSKSTAEHEQYFAQKMFQPAGQQVYKQGMGWGMPVMVPQASSWGQQPVGLSKLARNVLDQTFSNVPSVDQGIFRGDQYKAAGGSRANQRRKRTPSPVSQEVDGINQQLDQLSLLQPPTFKKMRQNHQVRDHGNAPQERM